MTMGFISFTVIALILSLSRESFLFYIGGIAQPGVAIAALYLGTLSSVGAFLLINFMLSKLEASRSTVFVYLSTVVSLFAGVIFREKDSDQFRCLE
jgi:drug/metabolite transporter (DMT)-like permease